MMLNKTTKLLAIIIVFVVVPLPGFAQTCNLTLSGLVADESTKEPLPFTTVLIGEGQGVISDSAGNFYIDHLCAGEYHIHFSHIGCETEEVYLKLYRDTSINVYLPHNTELLNEVVVHDNTSNSTQTSNSVSHEQVDQESNKNLSEILVQVAGVSTIKNGSGISKPVVDGLYGNRVAVVNNGVTQAGQQWGNDHAPEIDPFVASHLSVVKGAGALAYSGSSLGGVVLVDIDKIPEDPKLHGQVNYIFQTNSLGHTVNARLQMYNKWAAWRITGTFKKNGDYKAPDYYLTNTGRMEGNLAAQLEKTIKHKLQLSLYYSLFNTEIGILRGSHIGNLTDLEQAIGRDEPFFTKDHFSYNITEPKQRVQHHLVKFQSKYIISDHSSFRFTSGTQIDNRREYDVRRGGRSDIPALSLKQFSQFFEGLYDHSFNNGGLIKTGLQFTYIDNTNNPETGILPLIPDYRKYNPAAFFIYQFQKNRWFAEAGGRYDFKDFRVLAISITLPRKIEHYNPQYHNYSFSGGAKYQATEYLKISANAGYVLRSPEVNELYSNGLHQGVSGIEQGNHDLLQERSLKMTLATDWAIQKKLYINVLGYYQNIQNYIYLQPQDELRLTIRGAFPVFFYEQTNARLAGVDALVSYSPRQDLKLVAKYALVRGRDLSNDLPLIYIPADNVSGTITYSLKKMGSLSKTSFSINGSYTWEQWNLTKEQDLLDPPPGYFLLGASASTTIDLKKGTDLTVGIIGENLLNTSYRDYLNRLRYFADDTGINIRIRLNYSF